MKPNRGYFLIILCIVSIVLYPGVRYLYGHIDDSELSKSLDALVEEGMRQELYPGAVLLVAKGGTVLHRRAYGYAQKYSFNGIKLADPEPMTPEHLFDVASMTKVFATTFAVMLLVDGGALDLDEFLYRYMDGFASGEKRKIRIRHLLGHTAGLAPWKPVYYHASNRNAAREYIGSLPLKYPVGSGRHYSDLGFMILGYVIEDITGTSLDLFLKEHLYDPLGLTHTTFRPLMGNYSNMAATSHGNPFERRMVADDRFGYRCDEDPGDFHGWRQYTLRGEVNDGNACHAHGGVAGHAGLFSTVDDLKILADLLIAGGSFKGTGYVKPETVKIFLEKDEFGGGLGWSLNPGFIKAEGAPEGTFGHTGFTGCNVVVIPQTKIVIILLTNKQNGGVGKKGYYPNLNELRRNIVTAVLQGT